MLQSTPAQQASVDKRRAEANLPSLAVGVLFDKLPPRVVVSGTRKWQDGTAVQVGDKFHIGSCTKAMTATLLAVLVERSALSWEGTLAQYLPELEPRMHHDFKRVTLAQLTSHRAGLPGDMLTVDGGRLWAELWRLGGEVLQGRQLTARVLLTVAPVYAPGSKYEYSNAGYIILGAVMERVTGKSWERLMREEVFGPLRMHSAGFGCPADMHAARPDHPWAHREDRTPLVSDNPPSLGPAGTVHCSVADWLKFAQFHCDVYRKLPTVPSVSSSVDRLYKEAGDSQYTYGGWFAKRSKRLDRTAGAVVLSHSGSNTMNYATIHIVPARSIAAVACTNVGGEAQQPVMKAMVKQAMGW